MILFKYSVSSFRDSLGVQERIAKIVNKSNNINEEEKWNFKKVILHIEDGCS